GVPDVSALTAGDDDLGAADGVHVGEGVPKAGVGGHVLHGRASAFSMSEKPANGRWTERRSVASFGCFPARDGRAMIAAMSGRRSVLAVLSVLALAGVGGCGGA